ncbi:MAG: tetratricopeptide repeat protein [Deltaproteobacteria bacterium]|nr:tetratricopeptide repeat protein [Deltaproteobacteria bacterium]
MMMESGYIYLGMGRFVEAREVFEGVSVLAPESEVPHVAIGSAYFAEGKFDKAIQCYKKALGLKPDSSFAHSYMGEALFFKGRKEEAMDELKKAASLDPEGKSGGFAQALLDAVQKGFQPSFKGDSPRGESPKPETNVSRS